MPHPQRQKHQPRHIPEQPAPRRNELPTDTNQPVGAERFKVKVATLKGVAEARPVVAQHKPQCHHQRPCRAQPDAPRQRTPAAHDVARGKVARPGDEERRQGKKGRNNGVGGARHNAQTDPCANAERSAATLWVVAQRQQALKSAHGCQRNQRFAEKRFRVGPGDAPKRPCHSGKPGGGAWCMGEGAPRRQVEQGCAERP